MADVVYFEPRNHESAARTAGYVDSEEIGDYSCTRVLLRFAATQDSGDGD